MKLNIRQASQDDLSSIKTLVRQAFEGLSISDKTEHELVARLHKASEFVPELSIVGELENRIVGHIILSPIQIIASDRSVQSLALAPVSVHPEFQGQGIGGQLIIHSHEVAKSLGYESVILLGHESYYPRFGYQQTQLFGIQLPFDVPPENAMAIELKEGSLAEVSGMVQYPASFLGS